MRRNRNAVITNVASRTLGASVSDITVTDPFDLLGHGREMAVVLKVSGVTAGAGITASLWTGYLADNTTSAPIFRATADKSVSITGNGVFEILLNPEVAGDVAKMPLGYHGKVTVTTGAGSAVTVDEVHIVEPLL